MLEGKIAKFIESVAVDFKFRKKNFRLQIFQLFRDFNVFNAF